MKWVRSFNPILVANVLLILAGIMYNSWVLGFWLNPLVSENGGVASALQAVNQPYNWLFNLLDILTALFVMGAVVLLWRTDRTRFSNAVLVSLTMFALLAFVDTLFPVSCYSLYQSCGNIWSQPSVILHGIASIGSAFALYAGGLLALYSRSSKYRVAMLAVYNIFWIAIGGLNIFYLFVPGPAALVQDLLLINCSVWLVLISPMLYLKVAPIDANTVKATI